MLADADAPVLVLGGTGHYGSYAVKSLLETGQPVRVLSRSAGRARDLLGPEPEVVEGDICSPADVERAVAGARALVICVSAFSRALYRRLWQIEHDAVLAALEVAGRSGVRRVVYLSVYAIDLEFAARFGMVVARIKHAVEQALGASSLDWTVLGAPPSMEIFFAMLRGNRLVVPGGGPPAFPTISPRDAGAVLARAALREDLVGTRFRLAGPEALSFPEAASKLSRVLGRDIAFTKVPLALPRVAGIVIGPFVPFVGQLVASLRMLNAFPAEIAAQIPADHRRLIETFGIHPTTLEEEAARRMSDAARR
jgi:uncharacterized protein YbjT (DUF2867 family)